MVTNPDPIFRAIKRHRKTRGAFDASLSDASSAEEHDALVDLVCTEPASLSGCIALLNHLESLDLEPSDLPDPVVSTLLRNLRVALERFARQR